MSIKMRFIYDFQHSFLQFYQTNKVSFIGGSSNYSKRSKDKQVNSTIHVKSMKINKNSICVSVQLIRHFVSHMRDLGLPG